MATNACIEYILFGDNLEADDITKKLSLKPSKVILKGEKNKKHMIPRESSWELNTGYRESMDLTVLCTELYQQLEDKIVLLNQIKEEYNLRNVIGIIIYIEDKIAPALSLDEKFIALADKLKASIEFDFYVS